MDQCSITSVIIHAELAVLGSARFLPEALRAAHIQTGTGLTQSNVLGGSVRGRGRPTSAGRTVAFRRPAGRELFRNSSHHRIDRNSLVARHTPIDRQLSVFGSACRFASCDIRRSFSVSIRIISRVNSSKRWWSCSVAACWHRSCQRSSVSFRIGWAPWSD